MARIPAIAQILQQAIHPLTKPTTCSRRDFLRVSSHIIAASGATSFLLQCREASHRTPRIAIIGAGLAGLTAAYYLEKVGLRVQIYEAASRVGGRIVSKKDVLAKGIITELGGEFIDSNHVDILNLQKAFNLPLLDLQKDSRQKLVGTDYFFDGKRISQQEIIDEFSPFVNAFQQDTSRIAQEDQSVINRLDFISIDEYLHRLGISGWLYNLITTSYTSELGIASGNQSSLNLLMMLKAEVARRFDIYGESDERFKIDGGNECIVKELHNHLKSPIHLNYQLESLLSVGSAYKLSFGNGKEITADIVIITLPFSVLRHIHLQTEMSLEKRNCIEKLGYGMQAKLCFGVNQRIWRDKGFSGYVLSDNVHNGWDSSAMQMGNTGSGGYSLFLGGDKGKNLKSSQYDTYLKECNQIFPGIKQAANGNRIVYNWNDNLLARGAYACYQVGQVSTLSGLEGKQVGNIFFAGEHCSKNFQGFMNGAAETGRKAAEDIMKKVGMELNKLSTNASQSI